MKAVVPRVVAVLILLSILPSFLMAEEQWLGYRVSAGNMWQEVGGTSGRMVKMAATAPPEVAMPKLTDAGPLFGQWASPLAKGGRIWFALDRSVKDGYYDQIIVDSNGDGKLADEKPIPARRVDRYQSEFGPVKVLLEGEDGPVTYHLDFRFYNARDDRNMFVASAGWYEGLVTIGGRKWQCMLVDYNSNGTFNDTSADFGQIDRIGIGPVQGEKTAAESGMVMYFAGKYIDIDGKYYHPEPARDGACITFAPAKNVVMGKVRVAKEITRLLAGGENGLLLLRVKEGEATLPVGRYRIYEWEIRRQKNGEPWTLKASNAGGRGGAFEVAAGTPVTLATGEPLMGSLGLKDEGNGSFSFNQKFEGKLGERIEILRGSVQAPAPELAIKNADGSYSRTLAFSYG